MLVLLTIDLFFVPLVKNAATKLTCEVLTVPAANSPRLGDIDASHVTACLVDLTAIALSEIAGTATTLSERFPAARLIAFGPHVHTAQLAAAETAGFTTVLTRGQLNANIDRYMQDWTVPFPNDG
jgi:hypothetical protein